MGTVERFVEVDGFSKEGMKEGGRERRRDIGFGEEYKGGKGRRK